MSFQYLGLAVLQTLTLLWLQREMEWLSTCEKSGLSCLQLSLPSANNMGLIQSPLISAEDSSWLGPYFHLQVKVFTASSYFAELWKWHVLFMLSLTLSWEFSPLSFSFSLFAFFFFLQFISVMTKGKTLLFHHQTGNRIRYTNSNCHAALCDLHLLSCTLKSRRNCHLAEISVV